MLSSICTDTSIEHTVMAASSAITVSLVAGNNSLQQDPGSSDPYTSAVSVGAIVLVVLSFFSLVLCAPAFVWHIKNRNLAPASMIFWILLVNVFNIVNPLIWPNDDVSTWWYGQGYCDVEIKLDIASTMGLVGALACVFRSLAMALDTERTRLYQTKSQSRRQAIIEVIFCFGLPLITAAVHFVVQPNRYYIYAIAGCIPSYSDSWLSILLAYLWPPIVCVIASYYGVLVLLRMRKYRREFAGVLAASSSGLNKSRFLRLLLTASILLFICLPLQMYAFSQNVSYPITALDWAQDHDPLRWQTFIAVQTFGAVYPDRWIRAPLGLPVFLCFGLGPEAKALYRSWLLSLGFGHIFPCLKRREGQTGRNTVNTSSGSSSLGSKARLFFSRQASRLSLAKIRRSSDTAKTASLPTETVQSIELGEVANGQSQAGGNGNGQSWVSSEDAVRKAQQEREYEAKVVHALV